MVTPEFAEGMEPHEVPLCGPGMETMSPSPRRQTPDCEPLLKVMTEVLACGFSWSQRTVRLQRLGSTATRTAWSLRRPGRRRIHRWATLDGARTVPTAYRGETYQGAPTKAKLTRTNLWVLGNRGMPAQPYNRTRPGTLPDPAASNQGPQWQTTPAAHYSPANRRNPSQVR